MEEFVIGREGRRPVKKIQRERRKGGGTEEVRKVVLSAKGGKHRSFIWREKIMDFSRKSRRRSQVEYPCTPHPISFLFIIHVIPFLTQVSNPASD